MSDLPKIEPCPFCFSPRVVLHRNFDYVHCLGCGAQGHTFDGHPYDAVMGWNNVSLLSQAAEATAYEDMETKDRRLKRKKKVMAFLRRLQNWVTGKTTEKPLLVEGD